MHAIEIGRQFTEWNDPRAPDPDSVFSYGPSRYLLRWADLITRRRVVILAEAGSGKTTEMKEQAHQRATAGQIAFFTTVGDVAVDGLDNALGHADRKRLDAWRSHPTGAAWFFIDSIDEAKFNSVRLETVFRKLADGIAGHERRAHIILSGRLTDWEFRCDLERLSEWLPVLNEPVLPPPPTETRGRVSPEDPATPKAEAADKPLVVVMAALDPERVKIFARGFGISDVDPFLGEIAKNNLWRFARRPLDLSWLLEFWKSQRRLGSFSEMLRHSLKERLRETNVDRFRGDGLDGERASRALERVGAALVLGGKSVISVPDTEIELSSVEQSLDLSDVLPEWSAQDRSRLLTRAVFDPGTFGRVRLHNDNLGVVRAYLTARWIQGLQQTNLSRNGLYDLLFATTYGIEVIKPSMQETAAWLALWDEKIAREVILRQPTLLLTAGDPASLSLAKRAAILEKVIEQLVGIEQRLPLLDQEMLGRFACPELADTVNELWQKHHNHVEVRYLLLRIVSLGKLRECTALAEGAAFGAYNDRYTPIITCQIIAALSADATQRRYVDYIRANCADLSNALAVEAIDHLFPRVLTVHDLLALTAVIDIADTDHGLRFAWLCPGFVKRLDQPDDLRLLLRGLLNQLGENPRAIGHIPTKREEAYLVAIAATACRLLAVFDLNDAPLDTIDAALTVGTLRRYCGQSIYGLEDIDEALHHSPGRRRIAFWRTVEQLRGHPHLRGRDPEFPWEVSALGYDPSLQLTDTEWLLLDSPVRAAVNERRLGIRMAMALWDAAGKDAALLLKIDLAVGTDPAMRDAYDTFLSPPVPLPREPTAHEREIDNLARRRATEREERDRSWNEFIDSLRKDPDQLKNFRLPSAEGVDRRLFGLWHLLSEKINGSNRFSIESVAPAEPILGVKLAAALRDALIRHWRLVRPKLKSQRAPKEANKVSMIDCMGITGISLESVTSPGWAAHLSADEAALATGYATLEINGFPRWIADLAKAHPDQVQEVLADEISAELNDPEERFRYDVLEDVSRADRSVIDLMAPFVFRELERRNGLPTQVLAPMLGIIVQGLHDDRERLAAHVLGRFSESDERRVGGLYLGAAFAVDPLAATEALSLKLDCLDAVGQKDLVEDALPRIFGTRFSSEFTNSIDLPFSILERLVHIAFRTVRSEEDNDHPRGKAYSPDQRDNAEEARSTAFQRLVETPGRATVNALKRLEDNPDCPVEKWRLRELALARARQDSESAPWMPSQLYEFEQSAQLQPYTDRDLQRLAMRQLEDMQHDLIHADFAQGATLQAQPNETDVQNWVADRLRLKQGRSYSIEREPHVVGEKEPDIRFRAKASDANVAMEIKVAESWSLADLEGALKNQLCGRYLRARDSRHGILLVVHQQPKPKGWKIEGGRFLSFSEVIDHLRALVSEISGIAPDGPQPEIASIDVSTCGRRDQSACGATHPSRKRPI